MALNSTSVIKVVDLLCEGPISGIVGGKQGVYLDETPIQTGSSLNFPSSDVSYAFKNGGRTQGYLPQAKGIVSTVNDISLEIGKNYSETLNKDNEVVGRDYGAGQIIRQITDLEVDAFEVIFTIPRLFSTAQEGLAKGQAFNGKIRVVIDVARRGGAYKKVYDRTITGIALSDYQFKSNRIQLGGSGPWNVRIRKINLKEDHFEVKFSNFKDVSKKLPLANGRGNQIFVTSLIEYQTARSAFPYTAVAGLSLSTRQFNSLPTRAYKIRGRIVAIPKNASVRSDGSLSFSGSFDGSLKSAWTTCPVCCWYDMVVNDRYGAGDFVQSSNISWVDLYPLAVYANQQITTPDGGKEPRFACNTIIGNRAEAFNVLQDLASIFRGMLYWQANTIQLTADHGNTNGSDVSPVHLYNNSNVIDGAFNYSGTSLKTRSTSIRVRYNDPENFYKSNYVVVEDAGLISKYGYQVKEIVAMGATSKWQAQRLGRWMLASEEIDGEVVTFTTGLTGAVVMPGQVFVVADQMRQGDRIAGRVASATKTKITADQPIILPSGNNPKLTCVFPDGTIETKAISSVSGADINTAAFSQTPLAQSLWSISTDNVKEQKFRCLSVSDSGDGQFAISGVEHNDSIYAVADTGQNLEFDDITTFDERPAAPTNLEISSRQIRINNNTVNRVIATWKRGTNANTLGFDIRYKVGDGNYINDRTEQLQYNIDNLLPGAQLTIEVRSRGFSETQKSSKWITGTIQVPGEAIDPDDPDKVVLPPDPINVTVQPTEGNELIVRWQIPETGLNKDEMHAIIRHSSLTDGTGTWADSEKITEVDATTLYAVVTNKPGEYLVKFAIGDQRSENARSAVISLPNPIPRLNIQTRREDLDSPPFQGQMVDAFYSDTTGIQGIVLDGDLTFDEISAGNPDLPATLDDVSSVDFVGSRLASGEYFFHNTFDLGAIYSVTFRSRLRILGIYPDDAFDARIALIDTWTDIDGLIADDTSASMYFRSSREAILDTQILTEDDFHLLLEDGSQIDNEADVEYGPWTPMESGRYTGRVFQFKVELSSDHADQTPVVQELGYEMEMERRTESSDVIASGAAAKVITFDQAFYQTPGIGITAFNLASGDYYVITSDSRTGFTVTFYDSSDTAIDRNFEYTATGYGAEEA